MISPIEPLKASKQFHQELRIRSAVYVDGFFSFAKELVQDQGQRWLKYALSKLRLVDIRQFPHDLYQALKLDCFKRRGIGF